MNLSFTFRAAPVYAIYDTQLCAHLPCDEALVAWLRAGIRVLQYRHKGQHGGEFGRRQMAECAHAAEAARAAGALFFVNDRADVALLCGAAGVHVGQQDLAPQDARKLLPAPALVGYSTHNPAQLQTALAQPIDYLAIGPVFPTASKADPDPVMGVQMVAQARAMTRLPLVAIGGITAENMQEVLHAGADAVALISGLVQGCTSPAQLEARARELLAIGTTARA